jgi:hypothetical protein
LSTQLSNMQQALNTTQAILSTMTGLQNLHNSIAIKNKPSLSTLYNFNASFDQTKYKSAASSLFNTPIAPTINWPSGALYPTTAPTGKTATWTSAASLAYVMNGNYPNASLSSAGSVLRFSNGNFAMGTTNNGFAFVYLKPPPTATVIAEFGLRAYNPAVPGEAANLATALANGGNTSQPVVNGDTPDLYVFTTALDGSSTSYNPQQSYLKMVFAAQLASAGYLIQATSGGNFLIPYGSNGDSLASQIQGNLGYSTSSFNTIQTMKDNLLAYKAQLTSNIALLSAQVAASTRADPNSLYNLAKGVLADINSAFVISDGSQVTSATNLGASVVGLQKWIMDSYDGTSAQAGAIQQHITFAITSAENLNTQQQQNVQSFLFLFEEYYKSASAILQQITQIIQRMAQHTTQ